jgi:hypothetical protein
MKKTMQFLFAMCILFEGQNSFAGTNVVNANAEKPVANAPMVSPARAQQILVITVLDDLLKPIEGATVSAPCTGQSPKLTNSSGVAQFSWIGTCNCTGTQAEVTTSTCDDLITLHCNVNNQAICK